MGLGPPREVDIVCFYVDYGRPYGPLMQRMCATARQVMPDATLILLTDETSPDPGGFDTVRRLGFARNRAALLFDRARVYSWWMTKTTVPTILCDPDIEFRHPLEFSADYEIGVGWRRRPDMPVNSGLILAKPGCPEFWHLYGTVAVNLPQVFHSWWCDQLAYNLLFGVLHAPGETLTIADARIHLHEERLFCATPEDAWDACKAHHLRGKRKGPGWEDVFQGHGPTPLIT